MLLILGLGILIVSLLIVFYIEVGDDSLIIAGIIVTAIVLAIVLAILPCIRNEIKTEIVAFIQVKNDIKIARRSKMDPIERASLTRTIIENNIWLAKKQFRNAGFWDIFIPDEVDYMKKLQ